MTNNERLISALEDMVRQIEYDSWTILANDSGSGSAGPVCIEDAEVIKDYLNFAKTGDKDSVPNCDSLSYVRVEEFGGEEKDALDGILDCYGRYFNREDVLGFVVCSEHYDMPYTFYILHLTED